MGLTGYVPQNTIQAPDTPQEQYEDRFVHVLSPSGRLTEPSSSCMGFINFKSELIRGKYRVNANLQSSCTARKRPSAAA